MTNVTPLGAEPGEIAGPALPPAWLSEVRPGSIVAFRFPAVGRLDRARRAEPRPCLVIDHETLDLHPVLVLAHGLPATARPMRGVDVYAAPQDLQAVPALRGPYIFYTSRRLLVPVASSGFVVGAESDSPVIGNLAGKAVKRLDAIRARLVAERDMAAEDRRRRHHRRTRGAMRERDFTVERRQVSRGGTHGSTPGLRLDQEGRA